MGSLTDLHPAFLPRDTPAVEAAAKILAVSDGNI